MAQPKPGNVPPADRIQVPTGGGLPTPGPNPHKTAKTAYLNHLRYSRTKTGFVRKKDYVVGETLQGRPKIICNGYSYVNQHQSYCKNPFNRMKHWRCSQYNTCRAKAIMNENGDLVLKGIHSHPETLKLKIPTVMNH